ncbi:helix-turn-helix domain-containing protein [Paenibacillus sp. GCM10012303]|uniref:helix-turn-helix domain-containing protein n=1 Tax=Paenibacillus sp. GCM10012303 TaxID=3317340 RepID=UPI00360F6879
MEFPRYRIRQEIVIHKLVTCYYFELAKNYSFDGEKHDFWELFYVDKGELWIDTDFGHYDLKQGDLIFFEPNRFHATRSNGKIAPNVFIVSFECRSPKMNFFKHNPLFRLADREKAMLGLLMNEGDRTFGPDPSNRPTKRLVRKPNAPFAGEQMFVMFLEMLLIQLIRGGTEPESRSELPPSILENQETGLVDEIIRYLENHLGQDISLEHICDEFAIGKTRLSILFKKQTGSSLIEYANRLKIEKAKAYIREDNFNFTEIAELLGYTSMHYFSKQFKQMTGSSPSEYAKILQGRMFKRI